MKHKKITGMLITIMLLTLALVIMATPVSATYTETAYASYSARWVYFDNGWHVALGYNIPHDTLAFPLPGNQGGRYRPYVGGYNYWVVGNLPDHNDPQKWDYYSRTQISSDRDKLELLIPKTYVISMYAIGNYNWQNEIYIRYYRG